MVLRNCVNVNPKRAGFRPPLDVSRDNFAEFFSRAASFHDFFLSSFAQLLALFSEKSAYGSKVTQHYVIERRLKIWKFSGFVYKTYGKWLFVPNFILSSKMQYLHSLQLKSLLYLLIFNTQTIPKKKTIKYISRKNKEIHKKFPKQ